MFWSVYVYKAFILPRPEYCSPLFVGIGKTQANKLEDANHYIFRSTVDLAKSNTYKRVLRLANMQNLTHRRYSQSLILLFMCLKEQGPSIFRSALSCANSSTLYVVPVPNSSNYYHFKHSGSNIPMPISLAVCVTTFPDQVRNADNHINFNTKQSGI